MQSIREYVLRWGIVLVGVGTPLVWIHRSIFPHMTSKTFFLYGAISILLCVWLYTILVDTRYRLTSRQWVWFSPFLGFVAWMAISAMQAVNLGLAFWSTLQRGTGLLTWICVLVYAIIGASLIRRYGIQDIGAKLLTTTAYTGTLVAASVWVSNQGFDWNYQLLRESKGGGFLGNSSLAGAYVLLTLFISLVLLVSTWISERQKRYLWICVAVMVFSPLFINLQGLFNGDGLLGTARGALLGIIVGLGAALLTIFSMSKKRTVRWVGFASLGISVVVFIILWIRLITPGTVLHQGFIKAASGTRLIFWEVATKAIHERPIFGYGPENFSIAFQQYFNPDILLPEYGHEAWTDRPHNVLYEVGATMGWPGLFLYCALMVAVIVGAIYAYRQKQVTKLQVGLLVGGVVGYFFQNLFVFDSTSSIVVFSLLCGFVVGNVHPNHRSVSQKTLLSDKWKTVAGICLVVLGVTGWYFLSYRPLQKAILFGKVLSEPVNVRYKKYSSLLEGSIVGNHWDVGGVAHDIFKLYAKNPTQIKSDTTLLPYAKEDLKAFIVYAEKVAQINTSDYRLYLSIVHLYSSYIYLTDQAYDPVLAAHIQSYLDHARTLSPTDPQVEWSQAQLAAWKGDLDGLVKAYQAAIAIKPSFPTSHVLFLNFLKNIGASNLYQNALLQAEKDIPGFSL